MNAVLGALHYLALDYDLFEHTILGVTSPHDLRYASDTINGGEGDDLIVGDDGVFRVPFMVGLPVEAANVTAAALKYHSFLRDLEHVAFDFLNLTQGSAHAGLRDWWRRRWKPTRVGFRPGAEDVVDPNFHDLYVANDELTGGAGNDLVVGDDLSLLMPVINGDGDELAAHYPGYRRRSGATRRWRCGIRRRFAMLNSRPICGPTMSAQAGDCRVMRIWP